MYLAGYMVTGFLVAGAYAIGRLRGRWGRYERIALDRAADGGRRGLPAAGPRRRLGSARRGAPSNRSSSPRSKGLEPTTRGAPIHLLGWYTNGHVEYGIEIPRLLSLLAFHNLNATVTGLELRPGRATIRRSTSCASRSRLWSASARLLALLSVTVSDHSVAPRSAAAARRWFYRALALAGPGRRSSRLIAGWVTTEVGRQPWVVYRVMRTDQAVTARLRHPGRATACWRWPTSCCIAAIGWALRRLATRPLPASCPPPQTVRRQTAV